MAKEIQTTTYRTTAAQPVTTRIIKTRSYNGVLGSIVWFLLGIVEVLLALRVIFLLLNANPNAGFSKFIYNSTKVFVEPFTGIFKTPITGENYLDTAGILAMIVLAFVGWIIIQLIDMIERKF